MVFRLSADKWDSSRNANIRTLSFYTNNVTTLPAQGQGQVKDQNQFIPKIGNELNPLIT